MAVDVKTRGTVGCAYYIAREQKLYFMEDVKFGGPDVVEACQSGSGSIHSVGLTSQSVKLFISPTIILIPFRLEEAVIDKLDPDRRSRAGSADDDRSRHRNSCGHMLITNAIR